MTLWRRPCRSESLPPMIAPKAAPSRREEVTMPEIVGVRPRPPSAVERVMKGRAPEMTPVS